MTSSRWGSQLYALSQESLDLHQQAVLYLQYLQGDTTDRGVLENLHLTKYNQVVVLCNPNLDAEQGDAQTLMTLLHLRDSEKPCGFAWGGVRCWFELTD